MSDSTNAKSIQTDLLGAKVRFQIASGGYDTGEIRAVYVSSSGYPMLLVQDSDRKLVRVSHDSVTVLR